MSFKAGVCGMEYHNIDGTGWPDAVVVDNGGDIFEHAYETRTYFPVDRNALLALADGIEYRANELIKAAQHARFSGLGPTMERAKHDAYEWRCIARRIREALGVVA